MALLERNIHIAVLGCGYMGTSIVRGLLKKIPQDSTPPLRFSACVRSEPSLRRLKAALGEYQHRVQCYVGNFAEEAAKANIVLLGVPPDELGNLFEVEGLDEALKYKTVISLLAGKPCDKILDELAGTSSKTDHVARKHYHILRAIPTIGASNLDSVTLIAKTPYSGASHQETCICLFQQISDTHLLPENLMDDAIAVGAACHALAFTAVDAIVDASVAEGLPRSVVMAITAQSLRSASGLMAKGMTPESSKEAMSVPKSITINSALELEK